MRPTGTLIAASGPGCRPCAGDDANSRALCEYFAKHVAVAPYRANALIAFLRLLSVPAATLPSLAQVLAMDHVRRARRSVRVGSAHCARSDRPCTCVCDELGAQLLLCVPPSIEGGSHAPHLPPAGAPAVFVDQSKLSFMVRAVTAVGRAQAALPTPDAPCAVHAAPQIRLGSIADGFVDLPLRYYFHHNATRIWDSIDDVEMSTGSATTNTVFGRAAALLREWPPEPGAACVLLRDVQMLLAQPRAGLAEPDGGSV